MDFSSLFLMFQTTIFGSWTLDPWKDKTSWQWQYMEERAIQFMADSKQRRRRGMGTRTWPPPSLKLGPTSWCFHYLPTQHHHLETKAFSTWASEGHFTVNPQHNPNCPSSNSSISSTFIVLFFWTQAPCYAHPLVSLLWGATRNICAIF